MIQNVVIKDAIKAGGRSDRVPWRELPFSAGPGDILWVGWIWDCRFKTVTFFALKTPKTTPKKQKTSTLERNDPAGKTKHQKTPKSPKTLKKVQKTPKRTKNIEKTPKKRKNENQKTAKRIAEFRLDRRLRRQVELERRVLWDRV